MTEQLEDLDELSAGKDEMGVNILDKDGENPKVKIFILPGTRNGEDYSFGAGLYVEQIPERKAAISIRVPPDAIDDVAREKKLKCGLTMLQSK